MKSALSLLMEAHESAKTYRQALEAETDTSRDLTQALKHAKIIEAEIFLSLRRIGEVMQREQ